MNNIYNNFNKCDSVMVKRIQNFPVAENQFEAASSFGNYNLALSLADLVDNSISAGSSEIRIYAEFDNGNSSIKIIDNGRGMSKEQLFQAMKIGSHNPSEHRDKNDLGRFGLGMKTASFAQGRRLTVLTNNGLDMSGACWDLDDISNFSMEIYDGEEVKQQLTFFENKASQTEVKITKLTRLTENSTISAEDWESLLVDAKDELRLIFHRYLEGGEKDIKKIKIFFNDDENYLDPINPFYQEHPATQNLDTEQIIVDQKKIYVTPFILPHFSKLKAGEVEKLAGKEGYIRNQGFYIYRNYRLIIKGTWFKLIPHGELVKLARIKVDIPNSLDVEWKITVDKSDAQIPLKIQNRLKELISTIKIQSSRVFTFPGKKLTDSKINQLWQLKQKHGKKSFQINLSHPVISDYIDKSESSQKTNFYNVIRVIEETLPLNEMVAQVNDQPETISQQSTDPETVYEFAKYLYLNLRSKGLHEIEALKILTQTDPYHLNKDFILNSLIREGLVNTNE